MKRVVSILLAAIMSCFVLAGCTEATRVSSNISDEADNFKVFRRLTVINARSDELILELDGFFSIRVDGMDSQLEVVCSVGEGKYTKHFIGLNDWVVYTVEDLSGAKVDPYHYEIHYLPEGNVVPYKFRGVA